MNKALKKHTAADFYHFHNGQDYTCFMDEQQAKIYLNRSTTITRERFTWTYEQRTTHQTSRAQFAAAIKLLDGWIVRRTETTFRHKRLYVTIAACPTAVTGPTDHRNS